VKKLLVVCFVFMLCAQAQARIIIMGSHGGTDAYNSFNPFDEVAVGSNYDPFVRYANQHAYPQILYHTSNVVPASVKVLKLNTNEEIVAKISEGTPNTGDIVRWFNELMPEPSNNDKIFLIGYSAGGKFVVNLAQALSSYQIDAMFLIDPYVDHGSKDIPSNVKNLAVYYQANWWELIESKGLLGFHHFELSSSTNYFSNHPLEVEDVNHLDIDNQFSVFDGILNQMLEFVEPINSGTNENPQIFTSASHTHVIAPGYRCSKETNGPILCWEDGGDTNCWSATKWYQFNGEVSEIAEHRNNSSWVSILSKDDTCNEVYSSTGGNWQPGGPYPGDPSYGNDPWVPDADVHINHLNVKGPGQSNYHTESGAIFTPGQTQEVSLEGRIENCSNGITDQARLQYCATTKKKFRHDERKWVDEDYLDNHEREHDFEPGEKITKHGQTFITLTSDMNSIRVFKGDRSYIFPITEKHRYEKKIPVYFWLDTKVEVGGDEDYDVSCSVGTECGDEYAKFEVLLPWFNSQFNLSAISGEVPLTVNFTNTSEKGNGASVSYSWDFGDGNTSSVVSPSYTYTQEGVYTVKLTTTASWGEQKNSLATIVATVATPPIVNPEALQIVSEQISAYGANQWLEQIQTNLGPGETYFFNAKVIAANNEDYALNDVVIKYGLGDEDKSFDLSNILDSDQVSINAQSQVEKTLRQSWVTIADDLQTLTVATDDRNSFEFPITSEQLSNEKVNLYFYTEVANQDHQDVSEEADATSYANLEITLYTSTPRFTMNVNSGVVPLSVNFTNTSLGNVQSWQWDFGDGGTSTVESPSHTYTSVGTFTAKLTVTDTNNRVAIAEKTVTVTAPVLHPSVTITAPSAGKKWKSTKKKTIHWTWKDIPRGEPIKIEYSCNGGSSWRTIYDGYTTNDGTKRWKLYKSRTKDDRHARIRIIRRSDNFVLGMSPAFYIDHKKKTPKW